MLKIRILMCAVTAGFSFLAHAESVGRIEAWEAGPAELLLVAGGPPNVIGTISETGEVSLALPEKVTPTQIIGYMFGCNDDPDKVQISNPLALYEATPSAILVGVLKEKKRLGFVTAADSKDIADSLFYPVDKTPFVGAHYQWIYVNEPISVDGTCDVGFQAPGDAEPTPTSNTYALTLEPGWNVLQWEVTGLFTAADGKTRVKDSTIRNIDALPENVIWGFNAD
jgi:hypothetical protein